MVPTEEDFEELEEAIAKGGEEADFAVIKFLTEFNYLVVRCIRTGAIFAMPAAEKRVLH